MCVYLCECVCVCVYLGVCVCVSVYLCDCVCVYLCECATRGRCVMVKGQSHMLCLKDPPPHAPPSLDDDRIASLIPGRSSNVVWKQH